MAKPRLNLAPLDKLLLTVNEAASLLGVSEGKWRELVALSHAPPPRKLPGTKQPHWHRDDVIRFVASLPADTS